MPGCSSLVADGPTAPSELCDHIIRDSLGPSGAEDDVALLVLRALPISSERMDLKLAADPDELPNLRRVLGRWLHVIGASPEEAYDITVRAPKLRPTQSSTRTLRRTPPSR